MKLAPASFAVLAALSTAFVAACASLLFTVGLPVMGPGNILLNAVRFGSWPLWIAWALIFFVALPRLYRRICRRFEPKTSGAGHAI